MIRVGFVLAFSDAAWLGGVNYFRNLMTAIAGASRREVEPVVIVSRHTDLSLFKGFPDVAFIRTALFDPNSLPWYVRFIIIRLTGRDWALRLFFRWHRIRVVSHSGWLDRKPGIRTIGWIPDFQHVHLPELFSADELAARDASLRDTCELCTAVILSSRTARAHLEAINPAWAAKSRVVHFVSGTLEGAQPASAAELAHRYALPERYFLLPGQFWIHKNHRVVVEALALLKARGVDCEVVTTGSTTDYRQPGHFDELMARADALGVKARLRVLGVVPYDDVLGLLLPAVAMINPSRFEGWSTTVEEAKAHGKRALLSDIAVHREQAPARASYFDPDSPAALADLMAACWNDYSPAAEPALAAAAKPDMAARLRDFGDDYQAMAIEVGSRRL